MQKLTVFVLLEVDYAVERVQFAAAAQVVLAERESLAVERVTLADSELRAFAVDCAEFEPTAAFAEASVPAPRLDYSGHLHSQPPHRCRYNACTSSLE